MGQWPTMALSMAFGIVRMGAQAVMPAIIGRTIDDGIAARDGRLGRAGPDAAAGAGAAGRSRATRAGGPAHGLVREEATSLIGPRAAPPRTVARRRTRGKDGDRDSRSGSSRRTTPAGWPWWRTDRSRSSGRTTSSSRTGATTRACGSRGTGRLTRVPLWRYGAPFRHGHELRRSRIPTSGPEPAGGWPLTKGLRRTDPWEWNGRAPCTCTTP